MGVHATEPLQTPDQRLLVVLPALNESGTIQDALSRMPRQLPGLDPVRLPGVDEGSTHCESRCPAPPVQDADSQPRPQQGRACSDLTYSVRDLQASVMCAGGKWPQCELQCPDRGGAGAGPCGG